MKALAVDVQRNLRAPVEEAGLAVRIETRTGDTPQNRRRRQRARPPDILLTTPEQLALLLSYRDCAALLGRLQHVVIDELHALAGGKRGELLALGLARLARLAPGARRIGLSATVADPDALARYLGLGEAIERIDAGPGPRPEIRVLASEAHVPWSGHMARFTFPEVYAAIRDVGLGHQESLDRRLRDSRLDLRATFRHPGSSDRRNREFCLDLRATLGKK